MIGRLTHHGCPVIGKSDSTRPRPALFIRHVVTQGARPHRAAYAARPRRRGDRMMRTWGGQKMKLPRRRFLRLAAGAAAMPVVWRVSWAQAYPARPVTLVVFVPAGGTPDIIARVIGQSLSQRFGQSVVIDNRPGAGGNLALQAVARAPADGYSCSWSPRRTPST